MEKETVYYLQGDTKNLPRDGSGLEVLDQIQFPPNTAKYGCVNPPPGRGTHPLPGAPQAAITFTTSQLLRGDTLILINSLFIPVAFILLSPLVSLYKNPFRRGSVIAPPAAVVALQGGDGGEGGVPASTVCASCCR